MIRLPIFALLGFSAIFILALYNHWTTPERLFPFAIVIISALGGFTLASARALFTHRNPSPTQNSATVLPITLAGSRYPRSDNSDGSEALLGGLDVPKTEGLPRHPHYPSPSAPAGTPALTAPAQQLLQNQQTRQLDRLAAILLIFLGISLIVFSLVLYLYLSPDSPTGPIRWGGPIVEGQIV